MSKIINYSLYFFNSIILLFGITIFSYYADTNHHNKTLVELNCGDIYFLSFMALINSFINLLTIKKVKSFGAIITIILFSYTSYNIENISQKCIINSNNVWYYYLFSLIVNGFNIFIYILSFLVYIRNKKIKNKVYIVDFTNTNTNESDSLYIEKNRVYDVNNNLLELDNENIYE